MICFSSKKVIKIHISEYKKELIPCFKENDFFLLYKQGKYYGYIEKSNPYVCMVPDEFRDFEPRTLSPDENLIEQAKELFLFPLLRWIPIDSKVCRDEDGLMCEMVFLHNCSTDVLKTALSRNPCEWFEDCIAYGKNDDFLKIIGDRILCFDELNEYTYQIYYWLLHRGVMTYVTDPIMKKIYKDYEIIDTDSTKFMGIREFNKVISGDYRDRLADVYNYYRDICKCIVVRVPAAKEIGEFEIRKIYSILISRFFSLSAEEQLLLSEYCDKDYEFLCGHYELVHQYQTHSTVIIGDSERNIYLIGPCIAYGGETPEKASLAYLLQQNLKRHGLNYNIQRVLLNYKQPESFKGALRALDIKKNDYLIFIDENLKGADVDLTELFRNHPRNEIWFTNIPIHTTRRGNEEIAEQLLPYFESKDVAMHEQREDVYVQVGTPWLTMKERRQLADWTERIKTKLPEDLMEKKVGAIIMNANPFTNGHRYLVESSAREVDYLILFAVEEDASEFSFEDRFLLMQKGTQDISNVFVVPSGRFVLSQYSMHAYFEKEKLQDKIVDASKDVSLFGSYIAPEFHITVRFVGEEPGDKVTRQYNEEMKTKLPYYGVNVVEIPRITYKDEKKAQVGFSEYPVSASLVRRWYREERFDEIKEIVPLTTYRFLKNNPVIRDKAELVSGMSVCHKDKEWQKIHDLFVQNSRVIMYAIGQDCNYLFLHLNDEERNKVLFFDRAAETMEIRYWNRKVLSPSELQTDEYADVPILITSTLNCAAIAGSLIAKGIANSRIYINEIISEKR